jgi:DNA sulfur modification protein DndE
VTTPGRPDPADGGAPAIGPSPGGQRLGQRRVVVSGGRPPQHIRLSPTARDQLTTLVRRTKIKGRNVLCRWAFCRSLAEEGAPFPAAIPVDPGIPPIDWDTFAGYHGDVLWALLRMRVRADGLPLDDETLAAQFRLHLHRGIGYLVGDPRVTDIAGLISVRLDAAEERDAPWPGGQDDDAGG